MNKKFETPEFEVISFNADDVITTSGCGRYDDGCNCDAYSVCTGKDTDNN